MFHHKSPKVLSRSFIKIVIQTIKSKFKIVTFLLFLSELPTVRIMLVKLAKNNNNFTFHLFLPKIELDGIVNNVFV